MMGGGGGVQRIIKCRGCLRSWVVVFLFVFFVFFKNQVVIITVYFIKTDNDY